MMDGRSKAARRLRQEAIQADAETVLSGKHARQRALIEAMADPKRNDNPHQREVAKRKLGRPISVPVRREVAQAIVKLAHWELCRGCGEPLPPDARTDKEVHGKACQKRKERSKTKRRYLAATGNTFTDKAIDTWLTYVDSAQADILGWEFFGSFRPEEQRQLLRAVAKTMARILRSQLDSTDPADVRFAQLDKYLNEYTDNLNRNLVGMAGGTVTMDLGASDVQFWPDQPLQVQA